MPLAPISETAVPRDTSSIGIASRGRGSSVPGLKSRQSQRPQSQKGGRSKSKTSGSLAAAAAAAADDGDYDGEVDDILSLLQSTDSSDEENSFVENRVSSESIASSEPSKKIHETPSVLRDRTYNSHKRSQSTQGGGHTNRNTEHQSHISSRKVRFAGGGSVKGPISSSKSRKPEIEHNGGTSTIKRQSYNREEIDILKQQRVEDDIDVQKERREKEINSIKSTERRDAAAEQSRKYEEEYATLSNLVGPISESAKVLKTLQKEWVQFKAKTEEDYSRQFIEVSQKCEKRSEEDSSLLRDAVKTLRDATDDLKSQGLKEQDRLAAERSRLESIQAQLQREREQLLKMQQEERTRIMDRLAQFELERRRHVEEMKQQQGELQRTREDIKREKSELFARMREDEDKLERKRESLEREKEYLTETKDRLMHERIDFEERKRMAKVELQGADASRRELSDTKRKVDAEMMRLDSLREQLQRQTNALLKKEADADAKLVLAKQIESRNEKQLEYLKMAKQENERIAATLKEREERLLHSSLDIMKSKYASNKSHGQSMLKSTANTGTTCGHAYSHSKS